MRTNSHLLHTTSLPKESSAHKEIASLESEIESLKAELNETKRQAQADVDKAKQEAVGVMQATGTLSPNNCDRAPHCSPVRMLAPIKKELVHPTASHLWCHSCHALHMQRCNCLHTSL